MSCKSGHQHGVEAKIARLAEQNRPDLEAAWHKHFGRAPPKGVKRRFLERAIAYRLQAQAFGGLHPRLHKALRAAVRDPTTAKLAPLVSTPKPGTRLVREWNGRNYTVDVLETGYRFNGQVYRSLSAIARTITGARWSGPRFFGL
jgi:hypothetical protein